MSGSHLSLFWARGIPFTLSHHTTSRSTPILSSHLLTILPWPLILQFSPPKHCIHFCCPITCYMSRPSHFLHLTRCNHTLHQEPWLMYWFPFACDADPFCTEVKCAGVRVCVSVRCQKRKIRNIFCSKSDEITGNGKIAGWRDSWFAVRFNSMLLIKWTQIDEQQVRHTERRKYVHDFGKKTCEKESIWMTSS